MIKRTKIESYTRYLWTPSRNMDNVNADIYDQIIEKIFLQSASFLDFCSQVSNLHSAVQSFDLDETITKYKTYYFNQIRNSLVGNQKNIRVFLN